MSARHTLTRLRGVSTDDGMGGTETDWETPAELPIPGWAVDAGNTVEDLERREGSSVEYTARGPLDADVLPGDRMRLPWESDPFEVDGDVLRQPGPSAATSHSIVRLKRWRG